ncbi:unnamed protein product [Notodromas monacha]|uniref:Sulfatase N-terminal domain-containing protein n=1 Tax=Notodromas monacha TaxID=399045 RepID=A0A7R9BX27_9CRUS|nr:unnamed protein product [Notodromas monacha]CAG0923382.1 unnamed protein product [Notodromas monacha]
MNATRKKCYRLSIRSSNAPFESTIVKHAEAHMIDMKETEHIASGMSYLPHEIMFHDQGLIMDSGYRGFVCAGFEACGEAPRISLRGSISALKRKQEMTKRSAVCVAFVLVVSVFSSSNASNSWKFRDSKTQQPRPHIVFIMADDLGWNDVSFHGSEQIPTPNIDTLASAGIILNNYYVNPICTPSRSSLMTGRLTTQLGMQHDVISMDEPWGLPLNVTLLPEHLGRLGYRRHIVGKWHLGNHKAAYTPTARGFETHLGHWGGYRDYYDATSEIGIKGMVMRGRDLRRNMEPATDKLGVYATDLYTSEALKIIQHHDPTQSPLFLYVAHAAVHAGLWSNPLQAPRDTKATGWEGGVRGVGFIWSPWLKSSGRVSNQLMHMVDWLPTLFSAAEMFYLRSSFAVGSSATALVTLSMKDSEKMLVVESHISTEVGRDGLGGMLLIQAPIANQATNTIPDNNPANPP